MVTSKRSPAGEADSNSHQRTVRLEAANCSAEFASEQSKFCRSVSHVVDRPVTLVEAKRNSHQRRFFHEGDGTRTGTRRRFGCISDRTARMHRSRLVRDCSERRFVSLASRSIRSAMTRTDSRSASRTRTASESRTTSVSRPMAMLVSIKTESAFTHWQGTAIRPNDQFCTVHRCLPGPVQNFVRSEKINYQKRFGIVSQAIERSTNTNHSPVSGTLCGIEAGPRSWERFV